MKFKSKLNRGNAGIEILFITMIIALSMLTAGCVVHGIWKAEAIKHQAAHYEMNPTNGSTRFVWNQ